MSRSAHLVLWIQTHGGADKPVVVAVGVYSEAAPTSTRAVHPVAILDAEAEDYSAAEAKLRESISYLAKLDPLYCWIDRQLSK